MHDMCVAALAGRHAEAAALNEKLMPLHLAMFVEPNPIPVKWAVARLGLIERGIRLPLTPLSERLEAEMLAAMKATGREVSPDRRAHSITSATSRVGGGRVPFRPLWRGGRAVEGAGLEFQLHLNGCTWVRIPPSPPHNNRTPPQGGVRVCGPRGGLRTHGTWGRPIRACGWARPRLRQPSRAPQWGEDRRGGASESHPLRQTHAVPTCRSA